MADSYVCSKAKIKCSCGDRISTLTVFPDRTIWLTGEPQANISDHIPMRNIAPFGRCHTTRYPATGAATAAAHGKLTPMPCVPNTPFPWMGGKNDVLLKGQPALLKTSKCKCVWGGTITITFDGQNTGTGKDLTKSPEEDWSVHHSEGSLDPNEMEIDEETFSVLDGIQTTLDVLGFVPGLGAFPDLLNSAIYACRGDWQNAGLSLFSAVPGIGDAAGATKLVVKSAKAAKSAKAVPGIIGVAKGEKRIISRTVGNVEPNLKVGKGEERLLRRNVSGEKANDLFLNDAKRQGKHGEKPFGKGIIKIRLTEEKKFVRVHCADNQKSAWMMEKSEINGLTPAEIQKKFALPQVPTEISEVTVPKGAIMRKSVAAHNGYVKNDIGGGGIQYTLLDKTHELAHFQKLTTLTKNARLKF